MNEKIIARFWSRVDKNGPVIRPELGPCWVWTAYRNKKGYGIFWRGDTTGPATHFALLLVGVVVPDGMQACHKCDYPPCVNPSHLFVGTGSDNIKDSVQKGRRDHIFGENNNRVILTELQVIEIRERYARGEASGDLAIEFGVKPPTISGVCSGRNWSFVSGPLTKRPGGRPGTIASNRKFSDAQVEEIRRRREAGETGVSLAREFGVSTSTICAIHRKRNY